MAEIVNFDSEKASKYINEGLQGFLNDPPDTEYQRGYLAALMAVYRECLNRGGSDSRMAVLDDMVITP